MIIVSFKEGPIDHGPVGEDWTDTIRQGSHAKLLTMFILVQYFGFVMNIGARLCAK
jgi:hypothetical protein